MKPSPMTRLADTLEAGRAPPFDWVVEYAGDGTCARAWQGEKDADVPESFALVRTWAYIGNHELTVAALEAWITAARTFLRRPYDVDARNADTPRKLRDVIERFRAEHVRVYFKDHFELQIHAAVASAVRPPTIAEILSVEQP